MNAAISAKRDAVGQVDVIVAEDIAKFPDTNLAESLQRIPGVAIERDAGEGRQITVRGLGAQFTRVRVNGMETIATSVDGASFNRDRAFDFNVFASELFNSIVVNKTASAALDEGSLGAVIDLNTGNPLGYGAGVKLVGSAQARYNDLNDDVAPRIAGLFAWNNADETFGGSPARLLLSSGEALGAQCVDRSFDIAVCGFECLLGVHHARAGLFTEGFYVSGSECSHGIFLLEMMCGHRASWIAARRVTPLCDERVMAPGR